MEQIRFMQPASEGMPRGVKRHGEKQLFASQNGAQDAPFCSARHDIRGQPARSFYL
jgi:hypothetical protein